MMVQEHDDKELTREIASALNRHSRENASATPDFILATYLVGCLHAYEEAIGMREEWYGFPTGFTGGPLGPVDRS